MKTNITLEQLALEESKLQEQLEKIKKQREDLIIIQNQRDEIQTVLESKLDIIEALFSSPAILLKLIQLQTAEFSQKEQSFLYHLVNSKLNFRSEAFDQDFINELNLKLNGYQIEFNQDNQLVLNENSNIDELFSQDSQDSQASQVCQLENLDIAEIENSESQDNQIEPETKSLQSNILDSDTESINKEIQSLKMEILGNPNQVIQIPDYINVQDIVDLIPIKYTIFSRNQKIVYMKDYIFSDLLDGHARFTKSDKKIILDYLLRYQSVKTEDISVNNFYVSKSKIKQLRDSSEYPNLVANFDLQFPRGGIVMKPTEEYLDSIFQNQEITVDTKESSSTELDTAENQDILATESLPTDTIKLSSEFTNKVLDNPNAIFEIPSSISIDSLKQEIPLENTVFFYENQIIYKDDFVYNFLLLGHAKYSKSDKKQLLDYLLRYQFANSQDLDMPLFHQAKQSLMKNYESERYPNFKENFSLISSNGGLDLTANDAFIQNLFSVSQKEPTAEVVPQEIISEELPQSINPVVESKIEESTDQFKSIMDSIKAIKM